MIGDQLTYLESPFYNSNCSKPNGLASPFGEAQLDDTKLRSAAMVPDSRSCRNALPRSAGYGDLDELGDPKERTPASAKYTEEDFQQ